MKPAPPVTKIVRPSNRTDTSMQASGRSKGRLPGRFANGHQVGAVAALAGPLGELVELVERDIPEPVCNLLRAGDSQSLALLEDLDILTRLQQGDMSAGIQPGKAAPHHLDVELSLLHVGSVHVGDL